jgi:hypothetical protein
MPHHRNIFRLLTTVCLSATSTRPLRLQSLSSHIPPFSLSRNPIPLTHLAMAGDAVKPVKEAGVPHKNVAVETNAIIGVINPGGQTVELSDKGLQTERVATAFGASDASATGEERKPDAEEGEQPRLSKRARKRLEKQKRFEETRDEWKAKKKVKEKARKVRKREERLKAEQEEVGGGGLKRKRIDGEEVEGGGKGIKTETTTMVGRPARPVIEDITVLLDCAFDDLMTEKVCSYAR